MKTQSKFLVAILAFSLLFTQIGGMVFAQEVTGSPAIEEGAAPEQPLEEEARSPAPTSEAALESEPAATTPATETEPPPTTVAETTTAAETTPAPTTAETEPEATSTAPTEPAATEPTPTSTEAPETSAEPTEPLEEPTEPSEQPTETSEQPTEPSQTPSEEVEPPTEPSDAPSEPDEETDSQPEQSNPDGLTEFDDRPLPLDIRYLPPETGFPSERSQSRFRLFANDPPIIGTDHPSAPGEVMLFKQAKPVSGMVNTWDITVRVEAKDTLKTSDVVLVIDRSGSMRGTRMAEAKAAAINFVDTLLSTTNLTNRIALVSFGADVTVHHGLTTDRTVLRNAINGLTASGGTYTQAGVRQGAALLASSTADFKNVVLLSDGEPTYSTGMTNPDNYLIAYPGFGQQTGSHAPQSAYGTARVGTAVSMWTRYAGTNATNSKYYNHGNSAIAEAGYVKALGYRFWTVAFQAGTNGNNVLNSMASPGRAYTSGEGDLNAILTTIAGEITAAVQAASVNDPMGTGFLIPVGSVSGITATQGTPSYNAATKTLSWNIGTLNSTLPGDSSIRYAEMSYRVEIDDDILTATPEGDLYRTNGDTQLRYNDVDGQTRTALFPSPQVDPILLIVEKKLEDSRGNEVTGDPRIFSIRIKNDDGSYDIVYPLRAGERRIMTNLRLEDTYYVTETAVSGGSDLSDYTTTVRVYDEEQAVFSIRQNDPDLPVLVTNSEKPLGKLTVYKVFDPEAANVSRSIGLMAVPVFTFEVTGPDDFIETFTLQAGQNHVLSDLPYGSYTVSETDTQGFVASYRDTSGDPTDGIVDLSIDDKAHEVTVTNRPDTGQDKTTVTGYKEWVGGDSEDYKPVPMLLVRNGQVLAVQPRYEVSPTTSGEERYTYTWSNLPKYDENGEVYVYSIQEVMGASQYTSETSADGLTVTNTFTSDKGTVSASKVWNGGPSNRPTVWFKLYRSYNGSGPEEVPGAEIKELRDGTSYVEWTDIELFYSQDQAFTFSVVEGVLNADGSFTPGPPEGYTHTVKDGLIVTNTYTIPKENITATKTWVGGPNPKPDVGFRLYRHVAGSPPLPVPGESIRRLQHPFTSVSWTDIETTTEDGVPYIFTVREVDQYGNDYTPPNYVKRESGLKVINSYVPTLIELVAEKVWLDGPSDNRPTVYFRLHRYRQSAGGPSHNPYEDMVLGAMVQTLTHPETSVSWPDMPETDDDGELFVYYVREMIYEDDVLVYGEPQHYEPGEGGSNLVVVNQYVIPREGEATATKTWFNGPEDDRPDIWFRLLRRIGDEAPAVVPDAAIQLLSHGTLSVSWSGLEETDIDGNPYIFSVEEGRLDDDGTFTPGPPESYVVLPSDNRSLDLTNSYYRPLGTVSAEKIWENGPLPRPAIQLQLQFYVEGGEPENYGLPVELDGVIDDPFEEDGSGEYAPWHYAWKLVPQGSLDGKPYTFRVIETTVPTHYEAEVEQVDAHEDADVSFAVTNRYRPPAQGELIVTKQWLDHSDEAGTRPDMLVVTLTGDGRNFQAEMRGDGTSDSWTHRFSELPELDLSGMPIVYTVYEDEVPAGYIVSYDQSTLTITNALPALSVDKQVDRSSYSQVGEELNYTVVVTNSGAVPLHDIDVRDDLIDLGTIAPEESLTADGILEVGESWTYRYTHIVTQEDIEHGSVLNHVYAKGSTPPDDSDNPPEEVRDEDETDTPAERKPAMAIEKTAAETSYSQVGELLHYKVVLTNTGNVHLHGIQIEDSLVDLSAITPQESMSKDGILEVGESWTYVYIYTVTQADLDRGHVLNRVSATHEEDPDNPSEDEEDLPAKRNPAMAIEKTAAETSYREVGELLHYKVVLTNTGNVDLHGIQIEDSLVDLSAITAQESMTKDGVLEVGESWTYVYIYTVKQADLDRGHVLNRVSATHEKDRDNPSVDEVDLPSEHRPALTIEKTAAETSYSEVGELLHYKVVLTNTGNVKLTGIQITDSLVDLSAITPQESMTKDGVLEVGESWTYVYIYTVKQADLDRGHVLNRVSATTEQTPDRPVTDEHEIPAERPAPPPPEKPQPRPTPRTGSNGSAPWSAIALFLLGAASLILYRRLRGEGRARQDDK